MRFGCFAITLVSLVTLWLGPSAADVVTFIWRVTPLTHEYDGVRIQSFGINNKPADQAVIDVVLGQEVEVRVTNELDEPTCLHWHGLKQLGTQEMDGVSEITQCHINPNCTALSTPPKDERQEWEKEINGELIIQLADLYHRLPLPTRMWDNILINNRGRYNCAAAAHHNFTDCTAVQPLSKFCFQTGNKYLLRLINMAALSPIVFSIDGHAFRVVAADGDHLQPSNLINSIRLNAGQRYDIIVEASLNSGSFWMRANGLHGLPWTRGTAETAGEGYTYEGLAIVTYGFENENEPTSTKAINPVTVEEFDFMPLIPVALPESPSDRAVLQFKMQDGLGHFSIDGNMFLHFVIPEEPPLFTIAGGQKTEQLAANANARKINFGEHVEVVLVNVKDEQHPFHMHSHSPWVVGSGVASIDQIQNNQLPPLKLLNPMTRDVYTVPACTSDGNKGCLDAGYVVLRFTADNPGVWVLHCHIDWHLEAGLSMMLVEGEEELQQKGVSYYSNSMLSVCGSNSRFSHDGKIKHSM
ncbi:unnamed protein product [Peronospora belbahrii]|uniref:Laccase n=1 Tax=Peronospora belbahrii TaxID=622444 RepID=A0AAU9KLZ9_9STRA|nr:unnamed protein product [Peronospora belbahrii]